MLIKNDGDTCFQISLLPVYLDKYSATGLLWQNENYIRFFIMPRSGISASVDESKR